MSPMHSPIVPTGIQPPLSLAGSDPMPVNAGRGDSHKQPELSPPPSGDKDIEKAPEATPADDASTEKADDELLVTWDGATDPSNPLNWPLTKKWTVTLLTSASGLVTLMSGAMLAPALSSISQDLKTSQDTANMTLSIFVLAFAFGPMVLAPATEVFGRRNVYILCSCWYVLWNTVCGFARSNGLMLAARLLTGLGGSAEFAVSRPVLGDCWRPEQTGYAFSIATFIPLLGPALGPILGGVITNSVGWRWLFWVLSIFDGALIINAFFFFPETYEQLLLHRKALRLQKQTGKAYHTQWDIHSQPLGPKLKNSLIRPCWMLAAQPIIQLMSVFLAYGFGTLYFVLSTFASLWTDRYRQSVSISGVHYLSLVTGYTLASQLGARLTDAIWLHLTHKHGSSGQTVPEYRVPLMIPGVLLLPAGLFCYGWCAQAHTAWILVDVGAAVFGCGVILSAQAMQQYVMACYPSYVASASAASQFLRSVFAFCFPLFAPRLYASLGYGWGNSVLAFVCLAIGVPAPILLWYYGARLRAKGKPMW